MAEGVDQCFAAYAEDFIAQDRMQCLGPPFNDDAKTNLLLDGKLLPDAGKRLFQIERIIIGKSAGLLLHYALFNDLSHQLENTAKQRVLPANPQASDQPDKRVTWKR